MPAVPTTSVCLATTKRCQISETPSNTTTPVPSPQETGIMIVGVKTVQLIIIMEAGGMGNVPTQV